MSKPEDAAAPEAMFWLQRAEVIGALARMRAAAKAAKESVQ